MSLSWLHEGSPEQASPPPATMTDAGALLEFAMQLQKLDSVMDTSTHRAAAVLDELSARGTRARVSYLSAAAGAELDQLSQSTRQENLSLQCSAEAMGGTQEMLCDRVDGLDDQLHALSESFAQAMHPVAADW